MNQSFLRARQHQYRHNPDASTQLEPLPVPLHPEVPTSPVHARASRRTLLGLLSGQSLGADFDELESLNYAGALRLGVIPGGLCRLYLHKPVPGNLTSATQPGVEQDFLSQKQYTLNHLTVGSRKPPLTLLCIQQRAKINSPGVLNFNTDLDNLPIVRLPASVQDHRNFNATQAVFERRIRGGEVHACYPTIPGRYRAAKVEITLGKGHLEKSRIQFILKVRHPPVQYGYR